MAELERRIKETAEKIYASLIGARCILYHLPETFGSIPDDKELRTQAYEAAIVWYEEKERLPSWLQDRIRNATQ